MFLFLRGVCANSSNCMENTVADRNSTEKPVLPKLAYSMDEAAQVLGVSYMTIHRLLKRGLLRSSNAIRHKVIPHAEIERFLKVTLQ